MAERPFNSSKIYPMETTADQVHLSTYDNEQNNSYSFPPLIQQPRQPRFMSRPPPAYSIMPNVYRPLGMPAARPQIYLDHQDTYNEEPQDEDAKSPQAKFIPAEKYIEAEAKIDLMLEKIKKLEQGKAELRKELEKCIKVNNDLKEGMKAIEEEAKRLEDKDVSLDPAINSKWLVKKGVNWDRQKQILEDRQRREREKIKKEIMLGADYLNQDDGFQIFVVKDENCLTYLYSLFSRALDCIIPLSSDIRYLKARYDRSISGFFVFFRFLVGFSILTLLAFLPLLILHILENKDTLSELCNDVYPCFTFFSAFTSKFAVGYSCTIQGFVLVALISSVFRWIRFYNENTRYKMFDNDNIKYAKKVFNWWDWTVTSPVECEDLVKSNSNDIKMMLNEDLIKQQIEKRTVSEWVNLILRRVLLILMNVIILGIGWGTIAGVYYYEAKIKDYFSQFTVLGILASFVPAVVLALVKVIIPYLSMAITMCEKWDFASTRVKNEIWKLFLAYILNIVIICVISTEFVLRKSYFKEDPLMSQLDEYTCKEDQIGVSFLKLTLIEYFATILCCELINWLRYFLDFEQVMFAASEEAVSLLYFQALLWCTLLFYPYLVLLAPLFFYLRFKYTTYALRFHRKVPAETSVSPDTESFLMIFYMLTLIATACFYGIVINTTMDHSPVGSTNSTCGPFESYSIASDYALSYLDDYVVLDYIIYGLKFAPLLWLIIFILGSKAAFSSSVIKLLKNNEKQQKAEYTKQIEELNNKVKKLQKQLEYNRLTVAYD